MKDPTLRPRIWKILLRVNEVSADEFAGYVARGACPVREKIRNDTFRRVSEPCIETDNSYSYFYFLKFRTLATDRGFKERVSEEMLVRLLEAFIWRTHGL